MSAHPPQGVGGLHGQDETDKQAQETHDRRRVGPDPGAVSDNPEEDTRGGRTNLVDSPGFGLWLAGLARFHAGHSKKFGQVEIRKRLEQDFVDNPGVKMAITINSSDKEDSGPSHYLQLAVSKEGHIAGPCYNSIKDETLPITGSADEESQRADTAPALLHFGKDKTESRLLVRMEKPKEDGSGKQHIARLINKKTARQGTPWRAVSCSKVRTGRTGRLMRLPV